MAVGNTLTREVDGTCCSVTLSVSVVKRPEVRSMNVLGKGCAVELPQPRAVLY